MKLHHVITLALIFLFGCARPEPSPMTLQEQETAKKEVTEAVNVILQNLEKLDAEALFQSYANSPDFILFTTDGSMVDYQTAKNHHVEWFKALTSLKVSTAKEEFRFLPGNSVVCAWLGKFGMTFKAGGEQEVGFAVTLIFNKIDNQWKVMYQQTSALPPAQEKPAK
jgi:ketosteroid isomerase-like protein